MPAADAATGVVEVFDDPRGLGEVRSDDGAVHPFHCTAIADGSRTIEVGTPVRYRIVAGRLGRWEAADITPL
jgi:cold shock CspA family protein